MASNTRTLTLGHHPRSGRGKPAHAPQEGDEEGGEEEEKGAWPVACVTGHAPFSSSSPNTRTPTLGHHPRSGRGKPAHAPQEEEGDKEERTKQKTT